MRSSNDYGRHERCSVSPAGLREARMGNAPHLARAIPEASIRLVRAETYRRIHPDDEFQEAAQLHAADDGRACLVAVGRYAGRRLGGLAERRQLLERANDPEQNGQDTDARRGLRLLLHGSVDHRTDDGARLWINRHGQHAVWRKLWASIHVDAQWSLVPEDLAGTLPRVRWTQADIAEIDAPTLIQELPGKDIDTPEEFTVEERDEILSRIKDEGSLAATAIAYDPRREPNLGGGRPGVSRVRDGEP